MTNDFSHELEKLNKLIIRSEKAIEHHFKIFNKSKGIDAKAFQGYLKASDSYLKLLNAKIDLYKQHSTNIHQITEADIKAMHNLLKIKHLEDKFTT